MRWLCAVIVAVVGAAVAGPSQGSPGSEAAYTVARRYLEARQFDMALPLLEKAAAADPESPSGYRARLLQVLVLNACVGRCLAALSTNDQGLQARPAARRRAFRQQREAVAAEGYRYLRQLLRASQGYRQHIPPRSECLIELAAPERWNLKVMNNAEAKVAAGRTLTPTERAGQQHQALQVWLYLTLSLFYSRPGRDDPDVVAKVQTAMKAGERVDPWVVLAATVDTLAATVRRSLVDGEMGRARVVHQELRHCVSALLLKAPPDEGIVARSRVEASVKQLLGEERGAEWFHDLELATRLVKAQQQ